MQTETSHEYLFSPQTRPPMDRLEGRDAVPGLFVSVVAASWSYLAFFRGRREGSLKAIGVAVGTAVFLFLMRAALLRLSGVLGSARRDLAHQLTRCSYASAIFLFFFPEYLGSHGQPYIRSLVLLATVIALYFALVLICTLFAAGVREPSRAAVTAAGCASVSAIFLLTTFLSIRKYEVFGYVGQDLAYFGQIFYTTIHGHLFWGTLLQDLIYSKPVVSDFAGHNSPIMFLLVPFYKLAPSPVTLIVFRNLIMTACAIPVFHIARSFVRESVAWIWALAFLLTPVILYQSVFDFYPLSFAALPILAAAYYYMDHRFPAFLACLVLTLMVREDLVFLVCGIAAIALIQRRSVAWIVVPVLAGIAWGALSFLYVIPHFLAGAHFVTSVCFSHLGRTPAQMAKAVLLHPRQNVLVRSNIVYLKAMFTPAGLFVPLASPVLLLSLPYFAINLLAGAGLCITNVVFAQYSVIPTTTLFLSTIVALGYGNRWSRLRAFARFGLPFQAAVPLSLLALSISGLAFVTGPEQIREFQTKPWNGEALSIVKLIPAEAAVAAPRYMLPHLANRNYLYQTHRLLEYRGARYEYLIVDRDWNRIVASDEYRQEYAEVVARATKDPNLTLIYSSDSYLVYRRIFATPTESEVPHA